MSGNNSLLGFDDALGNLIGFAYVAGDGLVHYVDLNGVDQGTSLPLGWFKSCCSSSNAEIANLTGVSTAQTVAGGTGTQISAWVNRDSWTNVGSSPVLITHKFRGTAICTTASSGSNWQAGLNLDAELLINGVSADFGTTGYQSVITVTAGNHPLATVGVIVVLAVVPAGGTALLRTRMAFFSSGGTMGTGVTNIWDNPVRRFDFL